jgi:hypothetical protein
MIRKFVFCSVIISFACNSGQYEKVVEVKNLAEGKRIKFFLDAQYSRQRMIMSENTANDTFMIGVMKVPPAKTGKLYDIEFFNQSATDSMIYEVLPYKATKGRIVFTHLFYNE